MVKGNWKLIARRVSIVLLASFLVFVTVSAVTVSLFRDEIVGLAWKKVQSNIRSKTNISAIDLSFWSSFPMVSIELKDMYVENAFADDTLLFAKQVYLSFDVWDAWNGKYEVKKLMVKGGAIQLEEEKKRGKNWMVFNASESSNDSLAVHLKKMVFEDIQASYKNEESKFEQRLYIAKTVLKGDFSADQIDLGIDFTGRSKYFKVNHNEWIARQDLGISGNVHFDRASQHLTFTDTDLQIAASSMHLEGWLNFNQDECDAQLVTDEMESADLLASIPEFMRALANQYQPKGTLSLKVDAKGKFANLNIDGWVNWKEGSLVEPNSSLAMENVNMELIYGKRGSMDWVEVKNLNANLGGGHWMVSGRLDNLASPMISSHVKVEAELSDLRDYLKWDTLEVASGLVKLEADLGGDAAILADSTIDWTKIQAAGNLQIENGEIKLMGAEKSLQGVFGQFRLFEQSAAIDQLKFKLGENDFNIVGQLNNLVPFWFKSTEILKANINLEASSFTVDDFLSEDQAHAIYFAAPRLEWEGNCHIGQFKFKDFVSTNLQLKASGSENSLKIEQLELATAEGVCTGNLFLNRTDDDKWQLTSKSSIRNADIQKFFAMFHDFGQTVVKTEQISGRLNAETDLKMNLESNFKVIRPSIDLVCDLSLTNGGIRNLEWLREVADYIKKNRWIAPLVDEDLLAARLADVQFTELKNIISLQEDVLEIPWMQINTSAFNMNMRALHHLNVEMEYLFGIQVADLLMRDPSQHPKEDGKKIFVLMKGPVDNVKFSVESEPEEIEFSGTQEEQKVKWLDRMRAKRKDRKMEKANSSNAEETLPSKGSYKKKRKKNRKSGT